MGRGAANQESPAHTLYISRSVHPPTSRQQVLAIATLVSIVCATPSFQSMLWGDVLRGCPTPLHLQWFRILSAPVGCWIGNFFSVGPSNARTHTDSTPIDRYHRFGTALGGAIRKASAPTSERSANPAPDFIVQNTYEFHAGHIFRRGWALN